MVSPERLAVGQRYQQPGDPAWADPMEIARIDGDRHGFALVTFRFPDGREVVAYAAQIRAALASGHLVSFVADEVVELVAA